MYVSVYLEYIYMDNNIENTYIYISLYSMYMDNNIKIHIYRYKNIHERFTRLINDAYSSLWGELHTLNMPATFLYRSDTLYLFFPFEAINSIIFPEPFYGSHVADEDIPWLCGCWGP